MPDFDWNIALPLRFGQAETPHDTDRRAARRHSASDV
jgi:hypothetical protein